LEAYFVGKAIFSRSMNRKIGLIFVLHVDEIRLVFSSGTLRDTIRGSRREETKWMFVCRGTGGAL